MSYEIRETPVAEFSNRGKKYYVDNSEVNIAIRERPHFASRKLAQDWIDEIESWARPN